jgi:formylglycine-generating enzyme required for sulfatase activity
MRTIFLSSTSKDLQAYRDAVYGALCKLIGWHCVRMEDFTAAADVSAVSLCREKVDECDLFVGLIGHCYGSLPNRDETSFTEHEYNAATTKSRLMFIAPDSFRIEAGLLASQHPSATQKQAAFRTRVWKEDVSGPPSSFDSPDKLAAAVVAAVRNWEQGDHPSVVKSGGGVLIGVDPRTLPDRAVFKDAGKSWSPQMVIVSAGSFLMGSPDEDPDAYPEEKPRHEVTIKRFAIGRYTVTFSEFDSFCDGTNRERLGDEGWGRGQHPVINVSWNDAQAFVTWLASMTGKNYRLPTEAEWEYACRAGTHTRFYCGNTLTAKHANFNGTVGRTTAVGSYPANPWGLYDMLGNVWEHVEDPYHDGYEGAPTDGTAWLSGGNLQRRVVRGGSLSYAAKDSRSAVRCDHDVAIPDLQHGFRVALTL